MIKISRNNTPLKQRSPLNAIAFALLPPVWDESWS
jgi:hypothetical protein